MSLSKIFINHGIIFLLILLAILLVLYFIIYKNVEPGTKTPDLTANTTQNTISAGLTAVSIMLPLTVGILGYSIKQKNDAIEFLFCACIIFALSLLVAIWNLFRLPGLVNALNIANDIKTASYEVIQLYSLCYGFIYLVIGAWKIVK